MTGGWYRRNYYNMWWEDNAAVGHQNFSPFMITGPMDSRLVNGGGENIGLFNMDPDYYGLSDKTIRTGDLNDRLYDGFEFVIDGRMDNGAFFGGSYTYERTFLNECDVDNPNGLRFCDAPRAWQSMYKAHAAYPLPGGVILSGFVQGYPGPELNANYNVTAMADGTRLTGGQRITIDLLPPEHYFLPFQRKVDIRLMRRFNIGNTQIAPVMDLFNLFNANTTTAVNSTYGSRWQEITSIMQARYIRLGLEIDW